MGRLRPSVGRAGPQVQAHVTAESCDSGLWQGLWEKGVPTPWVRWARPRGRLRHSGWARASLCQNSQDPGPTHREEEGEGYSEVVTQLAKEGACRGGSRSARGQSLSSFITH